MRLQIHFLIAISLLASLFTSFTSSGQTEQAHPDFDRIIMLNGQVKEGKVTGISESSIDFVYSGESLTYHLSKSEISKIEFASGRTEVITAPVQEKTTNQSQEAAVDFRNKIAILPVVYVHNGVQLKGDIMEERVQMEFYNILKDRVGAMQVQDPAHTSTTLQKNGITTENVGAYTMDELAQLLGVEFVIKSILTINEKGASTYNSGSTNAKENSRGDVKVYQSSSSSTTITYDTNIDMSVYNNQGQNISTQSKQSFWNSVDAYPSTLKSMSKHLPFYVKP